MIEEAQSLLDHVQALNNEVWGIVGEIKPEQWSLVSEEEGWPLPLVVRHIGRGYANTALWIQAIVDQQTIPVTMDTINQDNAELAQEFGNVTSEEALAYTKASIAKLEQRVTSLTPAQAEASTPMALLGETPLTPQIALTMVLGSHTRGHLQSIKDTISR